MDDDLDRNEHDIAFTRALFFGQVSDLKAAIAKGADPAKALTPVLTSVLRNKPDMTAFLLDIGLPIDEGDILFPSPLTAALEKGYPDLALYLIERGAKGGNNDREISSAMNQFREKDKLLEALVKKVGVNVNKILDGVETPALNLAICRNDLESFQTLMRLGADPEVASVNTGWTALHFACNNSPNQRGNIYLQTLMDAGADLEKKDYKNRTPVKVADERGYISMVQMIYDHQEKARLEREQQRVQNRLAFLDRLSVPRPGKNGPKP